MQQLQRYWQVALVYDRLPGRKTGNRGVAQLGRAPEKHQYPPAGASTGGRRFESCHLTVGHAQKARCRWWGSLGTPVPTHNSTGAHPLKLGGQVVSARYYREDLWIYTEQ